MSDIQPAVQFGMALTTRSMQSMLLDPLPSVLELSAASLSTSCAYFFPDEHSPVVRAGCENRAEGWMCPGELPDWRGVTETNISLLPSGGSTPRRKAEEILWTQTGVGFHLPLQDHRFPLRLALDHIKYPYRFVRRACCQSFAIIIELRVMLFVTSASEARQRASKSISTHDHVFMLSLDRHSLPGLRCGLITRASSIAGATARSSCAHHAAENSVVVESLVSVHLLACRGLAVVQRQQKVKSTWNLTLRESLLELRSLWQIPCWAEAVD